MKRLVPILLLGLQLSYTATFVTASVVAEAAEVSDVVDLSDADFDAVTGAGVGDKGPWFVMFYAPWCGHCKALKPKWQELATQLKGSVGIAQADCTAPAKDNCERFEVKGFPTLIYFNNGQMYSYAGDREISDLTKFVNGGYAKAMPGPVPRLPTVFDKMIKEVYMVNDHVYNLWYTSKISVLALLALGAAIGYVAKSFTTPKVKERVKLMKVDAKKAR